MRSVVNHLRAGGERLPPALAIAFGLRPADPAYADLLRAAQINSIVRLTPLAMAASCLNVAILIAAVMHVGALRPPLLGWAAAVVVGALYYAKVWLTSRRHNTPRRASHRAVRRAVLHGALFGALWGVMPVLAFVGAPSTVQLLVCCLAAGMMCAGGFVLATVPLAGASYVVLVALGAVSALLQDRSPVYLALIALVVVYATVVIVNLSWNAFLFVGHFLAEAQIREEVAARERAQEQAAHAQRITALGELAGGIAHDFNNILQAVAGTANLIERHPDDAKAVRRRAAVIVAAAERGGAISRRLLAFGRREALSLEPVDTTEMLRGARELLEPNLGSAISIIVDAAPQLPALLADRNQLETVLLNLAANARDAMPNGGVLTFSAVPEVVTSGSEGVRLAPGRYLRITVRDSGIGMDAATLARAGEPFFTTKPRGKGTGLGLSMAKHFAEQSGGALLIASELGHGTIVTMWLPQALVAVTVPPPEPDRAAAASSAGQCHVLVVEDDELVRETLMSSLDMAGFVTKGAQDAAAALSLIECGVPVDALVTDFSMPGMNGLELIRAVRARKRRLPAILLTGHVGDIALQPSEAIAKESFVLLQKPIGAEQLAEWLKRALREPAP